MAEKLSVDAALVVVPPVFDSIAAYGIGVIAAGVALIWIVMMSRRNARRAVWLSLGAFCVMTISALAATSGLLSRFDVIPPPTMVMIVAVLIMSLAIALSRFGRTISTEVSLASLIGLQIFRLPLEMVMHHAGNAGIMPVELSYSRYNFDIVTGATALVLFVLFRSRETIPNWAVWVWNVWRFGCLAAIFAIAIATSPVFHAFGEDPRHLKPGFCSSPMSGCRLCS